MDEYVKVALLDNIMEAQLMGEILMERDIPYRIKSFYDAAYDGVFQNQKGWGFLSAPPHFRDMIAEILADLRRGGVLSDEDDAQETENGVNRMGENGDNKHESGEEV